MEHLLGVMRGNRVHDLAAGAPRPGSIDVAEAQHADHALLLAIDDRKAANLLSLHDAGRILHILPVEAEDDASGHHVARGGGLRIEVRREAAADDVAVSDHADEAVLLTD